MNAVAGGFVWPTGGVGEKFRVSCGTDEGCSEADWLRLNLRLWALTGETRFLDQAERLIWNHYAMNRTANGGYGHHQFVCDAEGPLLMQPQFTEAVWCCTFHGLLGLHTLKRHVVAGSAKGVFVNFPLDATAPVRTGRGPWKVSVSATEPKLGQIECRVRIDPLEGAKNSPAVFVRRPAWATRVAVADRAGREQRAHGEEGYLRLSLRPGAEGEAAVTFTAVPRVEDRRMRPVPLNPKTITRHAGVTLSVGPHVLMASTDKPRPVLVARVGRDGTLRLPVANRFPQVGSLEVPDATVIQATQSPATLQLAPWDSVGRDAAVAFVFDLIAVPEGLTTESLPASAGTTQGQFFSKKEYTPHPLPTVAALRDQLPAPICDAKPVWIQTYWKAWELAFRNFHEPALGSGYADPAREIALEHLDRVTSVFEKTGTIWENYAPDSVAPGKPAKGDFVGWSGIGPILFLLEYGAGLKPDALRNELVWDLREEQRIGCERYRFNGHVIDLLATPTANGKGWEVTIRSDGNPRHAGHGCPGL